MASSSLGAFDVVVVGGGPAGAATALGCADAGLAVALVTTVRRTAPPAPLESLNPNTADRLRALGALSALEASAVATFGEIETNGQLHSTGGIGFHVDRGRLDEELLALCSKRGVKVATDRLVAFSEDEGGGEIRCAGGLAVGGRWLVDATGRSRRLARLASIGVSRLSRPLTAWTGVRARQAGGAAATFNAFESGWVWEARVGATSTWTAVLDDPSGPADLKAASLAGSTKGVDVTWQVSNTLSQGRVLLVGDSAGSLDPATGQGVLGAVSSGIAAARTLASCLARPQDASLRLAGYDGWFSSGILDGADELSAMYQARGIRFHEVEGMESPEAAALDVARPIPCAR